MKCNRNEVLAFLAFLIGEGVTETRFLRLVKHGRAEKNWEQIGLSADEQIEVVRGVVDGVHRFPGMRLTIAGFPQYWDCRPFFNSKGCQAAIRLYYMSLETFSRALPRRGTLVSFWEESMRLVMLSY
jgi:hypothetical protein